MNITYVRTCNGRVFVLPSYWFEDLGDCYRVDFFIYQTSIYKGSIQAANTFSLLRILNIGLAIVGALFLFGAFQH